MPRFPAPACSQAPLGASCCCCKRCEMGGCDLRLFGCGCCFHTRCCPIEKGKPLTICSICGNLTSGLKIMPMVFDEIDQAQKEASRTAPTDKRGKKRKNATIARLNSVVVAEDTESSLGLRSGRWTDEETNYCDKLIELFEQGHLPIPDGIKLNDFLSNLLKSKQSRLTKKMKSAKLSARLYKHDKGYIANDDVAVALSRLETEFFASIKCNMERSEIRFHMQKEWRELFSNYCIQIGQKVDANEWLRSVEELDRRLSAQNDAARSARRKIPMGKALEADMRLEAAGVFIDPLISPTFHLDSFCEQRTSSLNTNVHSISSDSGDSSNASGNSPNQSSKKSDDIRYFSSTLIRKILQHVQRYSIPFEHVDVWVPSFTGGASPDSNILLNKDQHQHCRLLFAGFGTTEVQVLPDGAGSSPMSSDEIFDLLSFGEYSEKFSFAVGCGLPGRVYASGVASWEQGILNAPQAQFERIGGARQWGIQTVLGVPVSSPNVGRVVVCFYSRYDRPQNIELVNRLAKELSNLKPTPRWKLVVDIGASTLAQCPDQSEDVKMKSELLRLIDTYTPRDSQAPLSLLLPGFSSLRLLLTKDLKTDYEENLVTNVLISFASYKGAGRSEPDVVAMTARDFMLLTVQTRESRASLSKEHQQATPDRAVANFFHSAQPGCELINPYPLPQATESTSSQVYNVSANNQQCCQNVLADSKCASICNNASQKMSNPSTSLQCCDPTSSDLQCSKISDCSPHRTDLSKSSTLGQDDSAVILKYVSSPSQFLPPEPGMLYNNTFAPDFFDIPHFSDQTHLPGVSDGTEEDCTTYLDGQLRTF